MSDDIFSYDKRFDFNPSEDDLHFDPLELIEEALEADLDPGVFDAVDDRDMPHASNFVDFMLGKEFVALPRLFPRQIEICTNFLGQFCPRCTNPAYLEVQEDRKYLSIAVDESMSELLDNVQFLDFGVCKKCDATKPEFISNNELMHHTELAGCAGMRASKSTMTAMLAAYQNHRYLSIHNPARYFDLLPKQALHMTFVALTATQAHDTLWTTFKDIVEASPWFQQYHAFLDSEGKRLGAKLYDWNLQFFRYRLKSLVGSYMGANIRTIRGRTRYFTSIDESGWFDAEADTNKVRENAYETHKALEKSLRTVRSASLRLRQGGDIDPLDGLDCNVSSPSAINDPIMTFIKEAAEDKKKFAFHYSSWELNPDITFESLKDEMSDRTSFERDYGATPPLGVSQFISESKIFEKAQRPEPQNLARWCKRTNEDFDGDKSLYLELECPPDKHRPRVIAVDTGFSNNSFAVVVCSFDKQLRTVDVDLALELPPEKDSEVGSTTPVNFPLMYEHCIVPLVQKLNTAYVLYDRWQCVAGDTLVYTDEGMRKIKDLGPGYGIHKTNLNLASRAGIESTSLWGCLENRDVYDVHLKGGYSLRGTLDHKLLSVGHDGHPYWRHIGDMSAGDLVAMRAPCVWPEGEVTISYEGRPNSIDCALCSTGKEVRLPTICNSELARILGYQTSEGWLNKEFVNENYAIIEDYVSCFEKCFGYTPPVFESATNQGIPYWRVLTSSTDVSRFLDFVGGHALCRDKEIPDCILRSPKHVVVEYLKALFEGDGCASSSGTITYASTSTKLLDQVQATLMNFGIICSGKVEISGVYAEKFEDEIGFVTKKHKPKKDSYAYNRTEVVPRIDDLNRVITSKTSDHLSHVRYTSSKTITKYLYWKEVYPRLLDAGMYDVIEKYNELCSYSWRRVSRVEFSGIEDVYDFTVPGSHSFIANGIVSHNSIDHILRLRNEHEVKAEQLTLKYQDFLRIRSKIVDNAFTLPQAEMSVRDVRMSRRKFEDIIRDKPMISLIMQCLTVREVGTKIVKPLNGNDDIFRALSLCIARITDPEYTHEFENYGGGKPKGRQGGALGVYRSNSGSSPITNTRRGVRRGFRQS